CPTGVSCSAWPTTPLPWPATATAAWRWPPACPSSSCGRRRQVTGWWPRPAGFGPAGPPGSAKCGCWTVPARKSPTAWAWSTAASGRWWIPRRKTRCRTGSRRSRGRRSSRPEVHPPARRHPVHRVPAPGLPTGRRARCEAGVSVDVPRGGGAGGHPTAPAAAARLHRGYLVLAALMLVTMAAVGFGRFAYTVILPSMREGLNLTRSQMGFVATGNLTGYLGLALLGGLAASRWGSRRVILAG